MTRILIRHSRGAWREDHATALLAAARESLELWGPDGIDYAELAADIAVEAEQAQVLTEQIGDPDERIAGRIGDPRRFHSLAALRAYSGLVPKVAQSGQAHHQHGLTKAGDPLLREALLAAALLTRVATCWRTGEHYVLRDTDGRVITPEEGRQIVRERHKVDKQTRSRPPTRDSPSAAKEGRPGAKESQSAPASLPANTSTEAAEVA